MNRRAIVPLFVAATAGCSLVISLDDLGGNDAGSDARASDAPGDVASPLDGSLDAGANCDPTKPFTTVRAITELDTAQMENHASLSPDELQVWFSSDRGSDAGTRDIFTATRASRTAPFGSITMVNELSTPNDEGQPWISGDLLTIEFARQVSSNWNLFVATRSTPSGAFGAPGSIVVVNTTAVEWMPAFSIEDGTLYYASDREGGTDLWRWPYGSNVAPARVAELNSAATDQRPCLSADSLWIYWSSTRSDLGGKGALEIFYAHRPTLQDAFSGITLAAELGTSANEDPDWISPDLCRLYFHSNRTQGIGGDDLYVAERVP